VDKLQQSKLAEEVSQFVHSDGFRLLKYKVLEYKNANQVRVNANVRGDVNTKAQYYLGLIDGALELLGITERLPGEINKGKLDVDEALHVIENMVENKGR